MTENLEIEILPNDNCKELVATGEVLEQETLEDIVRVIFGAINDIKNEDEDEE